MLHLTYCIDEILAEIETALAIDQSVRALAQLDEREASGDWITAIDAAELRMRLTAKIGALPEVQARSRIIEAKVILAGSISPVADATVAVDNVVRFPEHVAAHGREAGNNSCAAGLPIRPRAPQVRFKTMSERLADAVGASLAAGCVAFLAWVTVVPQDGAAPSHQLAGLSRATSSGQ